MIGVYTGLPGSGKTLLLAQRGIEALKDNRKVYSNFLLKFHGDDARNHFENLEYWTEPLELVKVRNGLILIDEIQVYLNSRNWENLPFEFQRKLQLHRHHGLDLLGTVQNVSRVDVVFRELINHWYICKKVIGSGEQAKRIWGLIRVASYFPEEISKKEPKEFDARWRLLTRKKCEQYDSYADLKEPDNYLPLRHTEKRCKICGVTKILHT